MVQVSAGSTYDPRLVPNLPREKAADGGKPTDGTTEVKRKATNGADGCCGCEQSD